MWKWVGQRSAPRGSRSKAEEDVEMGGKGKRLAGEQGSMAEEETGKARKTRRQNGCLPKLAKNPGMGHLAECK
jgi:hypothetical protein